MRKVSPADVAVMKRSMNIITIMKKVNPADAAVMKRGMNTITIIMRAADAVMIMMLTRFLRV